MTCVKHGSEMCRKGSRYDSAIEASQSLQILDVASMGIMYYSI